MAVSPSAAAASAMVGVVAQTLLGIAALGSVLCPRAPAGVVPRTAADGTRLEGLVTRAVDGSSLDVHVEGVRVALGYLGIEAPAANTACGREALARNGELAGTRVLLEEDPLYELDQFGRRLYYAFTPEGLSIEETLVQEGLAHAVRTDARYGSRLAALEAEAKAAHRGCVWSDP